LPAQPVRSQHAALCWRPHEGGVQVLLITSRDTGRWVLPKGWPIEDLAPHQAAAREAWEEAGVEGEVEAEPLGYYHYAKQVEPGLALPCAVSVHALKVRSVSDAGFPESGQRRRRWFAPEKAARKVAEPELRTLLAAFRPSRGD
jgi:8-oxo-dGTP pyrophosphatase MutT (NUDIX family)